MEKWLRIDLPEAAITEKPGRTTASDPLLSSIKCETSSDVV
jgi:hypothetical protein